jgi:hypothetical protein
LRHLKKRSLSALRGDVINDSSLPWRLFRKPLSCGLAWIIHQRV